MIFEQPDFDLELIADRFTTCGDYTKEVILEELNYWKKVSEIMVLLSIGDDGVDGFLLGYPDRNSLWIVQAFHRIGASRDDANKALEMAKEWARERNLTSITFETKRNEMRAMERYGFNEFSVNMRYELPGSGKK